MARRRLVVLALALAPALLAPAAAQQGGNAPAPAPARPSFEELERAYQDAMARFTKARTDVDALDRTIRGFAVRRAALQKEYAKAKREYEESGGTFASRKLNAVREQLDALARQEARALHELAAARGRLESARLVLVTAAHPYAHKLLDNAERALRNQRAEQAQDYVAKALVILELAANLEKVGLEPPPPMPEPEVDRSARTEELEEHVVLYGLMVEQELADAARLAPLEARYAAQVARLERLAAGKFALGNRIAAALPRERAQLARTRRLRAQHLERAELFREHVRELEEELVRRGHRPK